MNDPLKVAMEELIESTSILMEWCVKNVNKWDFPQYDWAHRSVEKAKSAITASAPKVEDERKDFDAWFQREQGKPYEGMYVFAWAAWQARAALSVEAVQQGGQDLDDSSSECTDCGGTGMRDLGGFHPWGEPTMVPCDCGAWESASAPVQQEAKPLSQDPATQTQLAIVQAEARPERKRFTCPECGSQYWGTSNLNAPPDEWIGHCHGGSCKFTWLRKDDDKVFGAEAQSKEEVEPSPTVLASLDKVLGIGEMEREKKQSKGDEK